MLDEKTKREFELFFCDCLQAEQMRGGNEPTGVKLLGYNVSSSEEELARYSSAAKRNVENSRRTMVTLRKAEEQIEKSHDEIEDFFGSERTKAITLAEELDELMMKKNLKPSDVYTRAGVDRQLMSRLLNLKTPAAAKKETLLYLSIGLMLNEEETEELLRVGGYTLTRSEDLDLAVCFAIRKQFYDRKYLDGIMDYCQEIKRRKKICALS